MMMLVVCDGLGRTIKYYRQLLRTINSRSIIIIMFYYDTLVLYYYHIDRRRLYYTLMA